MRPAGAPDTLWEQALYAAGYRIIHEPYVLGEVNAVVPRADGTASPLSDLLADLLERPLAPSRLPR